jgi:ribA/ribD-fused uncharacterized protein
MSLFPKIPEDAVMLTRDDANNPLASYSKHSFELEGETWPSVEHYFQAMKFSDPVLQQRIREATHPKLAEKVAKRNFWKVRRDFKKIQQVIMTRGTYIKCKTYPEVAQALLKTGDAQIIEVSLYDYFWGLGRDQRGHNYFGKILMEIRSRLREEGDQAPS